MEKAINRGSNSNESSEFEPVRYEGYGPGGVAFIVDALTDNRNRTAGEVRSAFTKYGGSLAETNSVAFQFEKIGSIKLRDSEKDIDDMLNFAIEFGADEVLDIGDSFEFLSSQENFYNVRNSLETELSCEVNAELTWRPKNLVKIDHENLEKVIKIIELLEECDDVQNVSSNFEVSDEVMQKLSN